MAISKREMAARLKSMPGHNSNARAEERSPQFFPGTTYCKDLRTGAIVDAASTVGIRMSFFQILFAGLGGNGSAVSVAADLSIASRPSLHEEEDHAFRERCRVGSMAGSRCISSCIRCSCALLDCGSPPAQQIDRQNHEREHHQNVNEASQSVRTHQSQQPKDQQYYENCPKHIPLPFTSSFGSLRIARSRAPEPRSPAEHRSPVRFGAIR